MRIIKISLLSFGIGLIVGCTHNSQTDYAKHAKTKSRLSAPKGTALRSEQAYYPLPRQPDLQAKQPSLIPPGSNLARFDKETNKGQKSNVQHFTRAKWSEEKSGEPILVLRERVELAWSEVGKALRETDYQILDQDPSMSSYYILDIGSTDNQVTEKTPIYRIAVQKNKGASKVVIMNEESNLVESKIAKRVLAALQKQLA